MKLQTVQRPSPTQPLTRPSFLPLVQNALEVNEYSYARQVTLNWLAFYPGDLPITLSYVQALIGQGMVKQALTTVRKLLLADPEYIEAHVWWKTILLQLNQDTTQAEACLYVLTGGFTGSGELPSWVHTLRQRYEWIKRQERPLAEWEIAEIQIEAETKDGSLTSAQPPENILLLLAKVIHMRLMYAQHTEPKAFVESLEANQAAWPGCVTFKLFLAQALMDTSPEKAVGLLHEAVSLDNTGQTADRIWGSTHPYRRLWPSSLEIAPNHATSPQGVPVPAGLAGFYGWNQLPVPTCTGEEGYSISTNNVDESYSELCQNDVNEEKVSPSVSSQTAYPTISNLKQAAAMAKQPGLGRVDGRFPIYVIFSTHNGLCQRYGESGAELILQELHHLAETVSLYRQWDALVFLADKPDFSPKRSKLKLSPADPTDPWALKLALKDLDSTLAQSGEMIGAVLIVGGPEVVPFHHLPNPVDDSDLDVPSDNPYSTRDENYFIPEWSLGRIPGGYDKNPASLLNPIRQIISYHKGLANQKTSLKNIIHTIWFQLKNLADRKAKKRSNYGYSAAIWRRAALSVFRPIGEPRRLMVCPPTQVQESCAIRNPNKPCLSLPSGQLAYFNLHGLIDTDEWYGQRDPNEASDGPDFPIALRAADISTNGHHNGNTPQVIFTEACYGAHILEKSADQAISLKLLNAGCRAVVGSTGISYGSISSPLIAADLLGHSFWHYLKEGQPAGEALRRAKIHLAKEMHQRQGYLDGEDQKTLISFILYGDPLVQIHELNRGPKNTMRPYQRTNPLRIVCDRDENNGQLTPVPQKVMSQVKQIVKVYLPGMQDAQVHLSMERAECHGLGHVCPTSTMHMKSKNMQSIPDRSVVTLSKTIREAETNHEQFARLTLDGSGKLIKLVVSR